MKTEAFKYLALEELAGGLRFAVLWAGCLTHAEMAANFAATHRTLSAGFCSPDHEHPGRWTTHGRSESLQLQPRPGDAALIEVMARAGAMLAAA